MSSEFQSEFTTVQEETREARTKLIDLLRPLQDADLDRTRRGSWSVRDTLDHVLGTEWYYVDTVLRLRERPARTGRDPLDLATVSSSLAELKAARQALMAAVDGVDEETFYRLGGSGSQQYSVLSILENAMDHDQEHSRQIARLMRDS